MINTKHKNELIGKICSLQLSANLIIDLEDAVKAVDVIKALDSLEGLSKRWN